MNKTLHLSGKQPTAPAPPLKIQCCPDGPFARLAQAQILPTAKSAKPP